MSMSVIGRRDVDTIPDIAPEPSLAPTIFHEPWWLEIVCGDAYQEAVVWADGVVVGRLPYKVRRKGPGLTIAGMPKMTHVLGPALDEGGSANRLRRQIKNIGITTKLIAQLPSASHISFRLHGDITDTLAFDAAGFTNQVNYTVEIAPDSEQALWRQMRDKTRNIIRRAQDDLIIAESGDTEEFVQFYEQNLTSDNRYPMHMSTRVLENCLVRDVGRLLLARDANGNLKAGVFTIWDTKREYYFMSSRTTDASSGAISALIWAAIQHAAARNLIFDMDFIHVVGNTIPNLHVVTGFGGTMKPRFTVKKSSPLIKVCQDVTKFLRTDMSEIGAP
jgi:hypothetical protein